MSMVKDGLVRELPACRNGTQEDCVSIADEMRVAGVGGEVVTSKQVVQAMVQLDNGVKFVEQLRVVPAATIPIPNTDALIRFDTMKELGVAISKDSIVVAGKEVAAACVPCSGDDSCGKCLAAAASTHRKQQRNPPPRTKEHYVDLLETVGEQLWVPSTAQWNDAVQKAASSLVSEVVPAEAKTRILTRMMGLAQSLSVPPEKESRITAQARPCVSAQLASKVGKDVLNAALEHERARPAGVVELKQSDVIGVASVAFAGDTALRFDEALANTPKPTNNHDLFGPPAIVDQQLDVDFDAFCMPPLEADPEFEQKWHQRAVADVLNSLVMSERCRKRWIHLMSQDWVKKIFMYDLSNIELASIEGVAPIHLELRPDAQQRFAQRRMYSKQDIEFAGPMEEGLVKAGLLVPLELQPGETLNYLSQPLIPKQLQEDGTMKRRFATDYKDTVNIDMQVPKQVQWDTRDWHFMDGDVKLRSVFDGTMWYFQFPLDRESQLLTAQNLITKPGIWISRGLQLGLASAPAECIKRNAVMFHELGRDEFRSAMDELICSSRGEEVTEQLVWEHIDLLERLFRILHKHQAKVSLSKAQFLQHTVRLMGLEHGPGELRIPEARMATIRNWPFPVGKQMRKQLESTIAAWRWLADQGFATGFSKKMEVCMKAAHAKGAWKPEEFEECRPAFEAMKQELAVGIGVQMFDPSKRAVVSGDWSRTSMGGTLSQIQDDLVERPVAVAARGCSEAESKLKSAEGEIAVMAWLLDVKWGRYLCHDWFWYVADQQSLTELVEYLGKEEPRRFYIFNLIRSLARLTFYVVARPGKFMPLNDAMSRVKWESQMRVGQGGVAPSQATLTNSFWKMPVAAAAVDLAPWFARYQQRPDVMYKQLAVVSVAVPVHSHGLQETFPADERLWVVASTAFDMDELQRNCPEVKIIRALKSGVAFKSVDFSQVSPAFALALSGYRGRDKKFDQFYEYNGRLCHKTANTEDGIIYERLYIPTSNASTMLRSRLIFQSHNSVLAAHRKDDKTIALLERSYYWVTMERDVHDWNAGCPCRFRFGNGRRKVGNLGTVPMGDGLWDQVNIDYFGPLPRGRFHAKTGLLVISYPMSGRVIPVAVRSKDAAEIALKFVDKAIIKAPTQPRVCTSDNGTEFVNQVLANVEHILAIRHVTVAVRNPKANTMVERANRWIKSALQVLLLGLDASFWDHKSIRQALVYLGGTMPSRSRKFSPVFLETGVDSLHGLDLLLSDYAPKPKDRTLADRMAMLQRARAFAVFCQRESASKSRAYHDQKAAPNHMAVGDVVWVKIPDELKHSKLEPEFMGPYKIVEWVQKERRSAWVQSVADSTDEIRVPVDHLVVEHAVPSRLRLNFVPFKLELDMSAGTNSIVEVVEKELEELNPLFQGDVGEGDDYDDHVVEPGFQWQGAELQPEGLATAQLQKEKAEMRQKRRAQQLEEARAGSGKKDANRRLAAERITGKQKEVDLVRPVTQQVEQVQDEPAPPVPPRRVHATREANVEKDEEDERGLDEDKEVVEEEFEIERIVEHNFVDSIDGDEVREYFVKFVGFSDEQNMWIPRSELLHSAADILDAYESLIDRTPSLQMNFAMSKQKRSKRKLLGSAQANSVKTSQKR